MIRTCDAFPGATGCKGTETWCQDPRCWPYCDNCQAPPQTEKALQGWFVFAFLFFALIWLVLLIFLIRPTTENRPGSPRTITEQN